MRFGNKKPSDAGKKVAELLEAAVLSARKTDSCVWIDGSEASIAVADIARTHAYCEPEHFSMASSHALGGIYLIDRVGIVLNPTILADVVSVVGAASDAALERAYAAYLMATRAKDDGFASMLSATGSQAVLLTSFRIPAALDDLEEGEHFEVRKSLWGMRGAICRYSCLVGTEVRARASEHVIDSMQRHEFIIAQECAVAEAVACASIGVTVNHPWLDPRISGYVAGLHHSLRYQKKDKSLLRTI